MNPLSPLPKPLSPVEFYLLLALAQDSSHKHPLKARVHNSSLGSVILDDTQLNRALAKLETEAFIERVGHKPSGKSGAPRLHFAITHYGELRLQEEIIRLTHALEIAHHAGLTPKDTDTPIDIQRLILGNQ